MSADEAVYQSERLHVPSRIVPVGLRCAKR